MSILRQDLRHVVRLLGKQPAFTAVIIVSLALGIGANTMMFSFINGFLLRPLPYPDGQDVVFVWFTPPNQPGGRATANRGNCMAVVERNTAFEAATCIFNTAANIGEDGSGALVPERLQGQAFVYGIGEVVGVEPLLGRWFTAEEGAWDAAPVILISYEQWQNRFGGTAEVIGRRVRHDADLATIIGVMPPGFNFLNPEAQWWAPFRNPPSSANSPARFLTVAARMKAGDTRARIQTQLDSLAAALAEEFPRNQRRLGHRFRAGGRCTGAGRH